MLFLQEWGFSPEASFRAAPAVGPGTSVKVLVVADLGQGELDGSMEQSEMLPSINTTAGCAGLSQGWGFSTLKPIERVLPCARYSCVRSWPNP